MNINTSQSTDSLKGTAGNAISTAEGKLASKETSEQSGFFDKLTSLMFGSPEPAKSKAELASAQQGEDAVSDPLSSLKKVGWTKAQLEHLTPKELDKVASQQGISVDQLHQLMSQMPDAATVEPSVESVKNKGESATQPAPLGKDKAVDVPSAMDEGKQLLGKLQQANQTLTHASSQKAHGKDLPQTPLSQVKPLTSPEAEGSKSAQSVEESLKETLVEKPISQTELAQLIELKKQHPEMSEQDLTKYLVAQRVQHEQKSAQQGDASAIGGAPSHPSTQPSPPIGPQDTANKSTGINDAASKTHVVNQGAHQVPMQSQPSLQPGNPTASEHKAMPQVHTSSAGQDGSAVAHNTAQGNVTSQNQGANPAAAAFISAGMAKGPVNTVPDKGISEKALSAITDMKSAKRGQSVQDSTLAGQISSAAGQQLTATQKVDGTQQAASPQLQLSKEGADQVAEKVQMMMSKNLKTIDIRLDPPEMGKMHIKMHMNNDGGASVHFTVASHQARDAIEHSMPRLREMLSQQGVQLGGTSVQQDGGSQQQSFASANGGQSHSNRQPGAGVATGTAENLDGDIKLDLNVASKRDGISYYA
ncbi:flagellar hook-length control protein FliK [Vibrio palustris]|uniref:Flagellar hook-length control protein FliK n=1 Tax=Vibrio palustris TaxID=1918946 RepID=A0A1R4B0A0_9VIBR|nr:flagellar hook-length control protein FliK [Vibrio palustris]SJL82345.1 Flagellar hook-length control protein FliK [Vibrio palustris]